MLLCDVYVELLLTFIYTQGSLIKETHISIGFHLNKGVIKYKKHLNVVLWRGWQCCWVCRERLSSALPVVQGYACKLYKAMPAGCTRLCLPVEQGYACQLYKAMPASWTRLCLPVVQGYACRLYKAMPASCTRLCLPVEQGYTWWLYKAMPAGWTRLCLPVEQGYACRLY
jgi:hypothetical protein